jgi:hypothetical protein
MAFAHAVTLLQALEVIHAQRMKEEKALTKLAEQLPISEWVRGVKGFGILNLGLIIAETGDLSNYSNPGKVWKRMGLALVEGERQRMKAGADMALLHGYSPRRRAVAWNLSDCLIKQNGADGEYKALYAAKKAEYMEREWTKIHAHKAAQRYMGKRVIRDLWRAWRDLHGVVDEQKMAYGGEA